METEPLTQKEKRKIRWRIRDIESKEEAIQKQKEEKEKELERVLKQVEDVEHQLQKAMQHYHASFSGGSKEEQKRTAQRLEKCEAEQKRLLEKRNYLKEHISELSESAVSLAADKLRAGIWLMSDAQREKFREKFEIDKEAIKHIVSMQNELLNKDADD